MRSRTGPSSRSSRAPAIGFAATEAPRGLLYHRYRLEADGTIAEARIVPPTSQNQAEHRGGSRHLHRADCSTCPTTSCASAASRPCATTIPASPARRISCAWRWTGAEGSTGAAGRRLVLGIGNPERGDDAVGLRGRAPAAADAAGGGRGGGARGRRRLAPGPARRRRRGASRRCLRRRRVRRGRCGASMSLSRPCRTEPSASPPMASALPRRSSWRATLGRLPPRCIVYAIEGRSFALGEPLSPPVSQAVADVARRVAAEIAGDMPAAE